MTTSKPTIPGTLKPLAPFFHDIELDEGHNTAPETNRMKEMENLYFPVLTSMCGGNLSGKRILDIGCNCGGFSFASIKHGAAEVVGIDIDQKNIDRALAVKKYLGTRNVKFLRMGVEEVSDKLGTFDITILAGIAYHLSNPIQIFKDISAITERILMIDSHVHYTANTAIEDTPSWWMLTDTDQNNLDGLFVDNPAMLKNYNTFEKSHEVNYSKLTEQFLPSPHTLQDMDFVSKNVPNSSGEVRLDCNIGSAKQGQMVLIPNKKALINLTRHIGFEDICEVVPHRFSSLPYLGRFRIGLVAVKRSVEGSFPISLNHYKLKV